MERFNRITLGILLTCSMPLYAQAQQTVDQESDAQQQTKNEEMPVATLFYLVNMYSGESRRCGDLGAVISGVR